MVAYSYDNITKEYVGEVERQKNPLEPEKWLLPMDSAAIAPPETLVGSVALWTGENWEIVEDARLKTLWHKQTKKVFHPSHPAFKPGSGLTDEKPPEEVEGKIIVWCKICRGGNGKWLLKDRDIAEETIQKSEKTISKTYWRKWDRTAFKDEVPGFKLTKEFTDKEPPVGAYVYWNESLQTWEIDEKKEVLNTELNSLQKKFNMTNDMETIAGALLAHVEEKPISTTLIELKKKLSRYKELVKILTPENGGCKDCSEDDLGLF